jgi:hypothetical protein
MYTDACERRRHHGQRGRAADIDVTVIARG